MVLLGSFLILNLVRNHLLLLLEWHVDLLLSLTTGAVDLLKNVGQLSACDVRGRPIRPPSFTAYGCRRGNYVLLPSQRLLLPAATRLFVVIDGSGGLGIGSYPRRAVLAITVCGDLLLKSRWRLLSCQLGLLLQLLHLSVSLVLVLLQWHIAHIFPQRMGRQAHV